MAILIRNLTEKQEKELSIIQEKYNEKTATKAVLKVLEKYNDLEEENRRLRIQYQNSARELNKFKETFKQIQWNIELLTDDDNTDMY